MNELASTLAERLYEGFAWSDTPQGFLYWEGVHRELRRLAGYAHLATPPQPDQLTIDGWDLT